MARVTLSPLTDIEGAFEVVERKGLGHPDTICDALAETFSRRLCLEYRNRVGAVLHHNVDKVLLAGGRAEPAFDGGKVIAPIAIYLAGRAVAGVGDIRIPIQEIAIEGSRAWLREHLHALDPDRDVAFHVVTQPGSHDLQSLFRRHGADAVALANDSSIGAGYAPMSPLELLVLAVEKRINACCGGPAQAWGEDVKVMGLRHGESVRLTVACAMIGRHLADLDDYVRQTNALREFVRQIAAEHGFPRCEVLVNAADDLAQGQVYLTVTGTSAEAGDDGEVGRGNRVNGLITPCRPMTLEAAAGKNPRSHTGKIYSVAARAIAETLIAEVREIHEAHCILVSEIGRPITEPAAVEVRIATKGIPVEELRKRVEAVVARSLLCMPALVDDFIEGRIEVY